MSLRIVAVSAPDYLMGRLDTNSLTSKDPVSLHNACRYAAFLAENKIGAWGDSNWAVPRKERRQKLLLMNSFKEEASFLEDMLIKESPNLLLIGAMTLCLPGAVECAKIAKQIFGDKICIVLGGRHVNETMYYSKKWNKVKHHAGSPLVLMLKREIDRVFDIVVSGEGEFVIVKIGEAVEYLVRKNDDLKNVLNYIDQAELGKIPGKWIIGGIINDQIKEIIGDGLEIDRDKLPSPARMFGIRNKFNVFGDRLTGHAFSDIGSGCIYNCSFCSERNNVCGSLRQIETAGYRLFRQLLDIKEVIYEDNSNTKASAFIEDSLMLGGLDIQIRRLISLLNFHPIEIKFGGQLTVDTAIKHKTLIKELSYLGFEYLFFGIETINPSLVGGMSKDICKDDWISRVESLIEFLSNSKILIGVSILFGLGESQQSRIELIKKISNWQKEYRSLKVVSFNWAVQHPLCGYDGNCNYSYKEWGISSLDYIEAFRDYGEASVLYPLSNVKVPKIEELNELRELRKTIDG
ncbi:B12-binding domain/radical SAM domain-containing protein [bacterium]|nr:MAG: B12-binding domain/radical SAM domain-containing protein [bacterium]